VVADGVSRVSAIAAAVAGLAVFAAPAVASDVTRVKLGSELGDLIVSNDGGAWVEIVRPNGVAIGRALPGGGFRASGTGFASIGRTLGPDGQAWFNVGARHYVRLDGAGNATKVAPLPAGPTLGRAMATGPDGTLWNLTPAGGRVAHITPQGTVTYTATNMPKCAVGGDAPIFAAMERAADGAMWAVDQGCDRLVRLTAAGASAFAVDSDVVAIAPDAVGGVWFAGNGFGHVDAAGVLRRFTFEDVEASDVAVAPDGSAWFALDTCFLGRVSNTGEVTTVPAPLPVERIGFDPAGGMWLAGRTRLVHLAPREPFGPCDSRPASLRITPSHGTINLQALRRGLRIAVREPAVVEATGYLSGDSSEDELAEGPALYRVLTRAGSFRYRLHASDLRRIARRLAAGKRAGIGMYVVVTDADGNSDVVQTTLRIRR
jgi:streptogramin lyase